MLVGGMAMLCACQPSQQNNSYTVTGELDDSTHNGKKIYVMRYDDETMIDSTIIDGNKFVFKGQVDTAALCRIDVDRHTFANFILEVGDIKVNFKDYAQPSGTPQNDAMAQIAKEEDAINAAVEQKFNEIDQQYADNEKAAEAAKEQYVETIKTKLANRAAELYSTHNNDAVGYYLLYSVFMDVIDNTAKEKIMSSFGPWLKSQKMVANRLELLKRLKMTAEGMPFVDIEGTDADGNPSALSHYVGKGNYVLLDMWASWCSPCMGEIPNLMKLHRQYKDKGLTVLGLFVWDEESNMKKAIDKEGIEWPQIVPSDNMEPMSLYGVDGIPHIILFAPDGTILKRNLRGQSMINAVNEVMNK